MAMRGSKHGKLQHCREVIRDCLNIVEEKGDTFVCHPKGDETGVCDPRLHDPHAVDLIRHRGGIRILFAEGNETEMYRTANELNSESVTGWHTIVLKDSGSIYMYRQCLWIS